MQLKEYRDSIAYHTGLAAGWDLRYARGGFKRRAEFFRRTVMPKLELRGDWLDLGCGSGYFSRMLCEAGARVSGIDGSPEMIRMARSLSAASATTGAISFSTMELAGPLRLPSAALDGVICLSVLEYLDSPEACFAEIVRIVKPGGQIVVSVPNPQSTVRRVQQTKRRLSRKHDRGGEAYLGFSRWGASFDALRSLAGARELSVIEILPFDPILPQIAARILPASLLYLIARKPVRGEASSASPIPSSPSP